MCNRYIKIKVLVQQELLETTLNIGLFDLNSVCVEDDSKELP